MKGLEIIHSKELGMKRSFSEAGKTLFPHAHACAVSMRECHASSAKTIKVPVV